MLKDFAPQLEPTCRGMTGRCGSRIGAQAAALVAPPWPAMRDDYYELLGIRSTATAKVGETGREKEGEPPVLSSFNNEMFKDIFRMFKAFL